jgi:hypothetical protein
LNKKHADLRVFFISSSFDLKRSFKVFLPMNNNADLVSVFFVWQNFSQLKRNRSEFLAQIERFV